MSGDHEQDYFADGMVEDIVTGLSRIKWLFLIARNSSFVYKGKAADVRQVGRELESLLPQDRGRLRGRGAFAWLRSRRPLHAFRFRSGERIRPSCPG